MEALSTIQLKDFRELFGFEDRQVRFVLERGYVPPGVAESPCTGNRREFGFGQAYWLAIAVLLRSNGLKTPVAAEIAGLTTEGLRVATQNFNWDRTLQHKWGWLEIGYEYVLEVGDRKFIRLLTTSCPSCEGQYEFGWRPIKGRGPVCAQYRPFVTVRLDLTKIARVLGKVDSWAYPQRSQGPKGEASR